MAYVKNTWTNQQVERPKTYQMNTNSDGSVTLVDDFGLVTDLGTPVNADNMNHIEDGIADIHNLIKVEDEKFYYFDGKEWAQVKGGGGSGLKTGMLISSLVPLEDADLHRADGALLVGEGSYGEFVNFMANKVATSPDDFTTEDKWQSDVATYGVCRQFVYNAEANTLRLPKITGFIEGGVGGDVNEAGLPNIQGSMQFVTHNDDVTSGAIKRTYYSSGVNGFNAGGYFVGGWGPAKYELNAKDVSAIYKDNFNTVQPQSVNVYYYIVVGTSVSVDIEVDIKEKLTTINPFSLFECKYSDHRLSNASWYVGGTTWTKDTFPTAWEALQVERNEAVAVDTVVQLPSGTSYAKQGLSVKTSTSEDVALSDIVIDLDNEQFTLPTKSDLISKYDYTVDYSGCIQNCSSPYTAPKDGYLMWNKSGTANCTVNGIDIALGGNDSYNEGSVTLPVNKGDVISVTADSASPIVFIPLKGEQVESAQLYFYLGETAVNLNEVNVGALAQNISRKLEVVENYTNGTSWYRVYSDGWCEQGGRFSNNANVQNTITFLKPFKDTNYYVTRSSGIGAYNASTYAIHNTDVQDLTPTSFKAYTYSGAGLDNFIWEAKGYIR